MKNQYFGDINDYLKYGLLRCLANTGLTIGVCWMLTPEDGRSDGRKISYLDDTANWRRYDPILYDWLAIAVKSKARHVRGARPFLDNAIFFAKLVPDDVSSRTTWLKEALTKLSTVDLLFLDPDNGIEVQSKRKGSPGSSKYLYWDEIQKVWTSKKSLLIFQHFPRANHQLFASRLTGECRERLHTEAVVPLMTSNVLFLLACQPEHTARIDLALDAITAAWADRITPLSPK